MGRHANSDETPLQEAAQMAWPQGHYEDAPADLTPGRIEEIHDRARPADHIVLALVATPAAWQSFGLTSAQTMLMRSLVTTHPTTVAALGSPHVLDAVPAEAHAQLCTFSDVPASQKALVEHLTASPDL
jgi:hypothetical protein